MLIICRNEIKIPVSFPQNPQIGGQLTPLSDISDVSFTASLILSVILNSGFCKFSLDDVSSGEFNFLALIGVSEETAVPKG